MSLRSSICATLPFALLFGCGSATPAPSDAGSDPTSAAVADMPADDAAAAAPAGVTGDAGAAMTGPSDKPSDKPGDQAAAAGSSNSKKDADALVLEITIAPKGKAKIDDTIKSGLMTAANERIKTSTKLALDAKGIATPRKVIANLLIEEPTVDKKKGLSVRLELTGVSKDGQCPLFSLGSNVAMTDGKPDKAEDVAELRKGALMALLDQLEQTAPTVKPTNNCTVNKH